MHYYCYEGNHLFSMEQLNGFEEVSETSARNLLNGNLYYIKKTDPKKSRRSFSVSDTSLLFTEDEGLNLLQEDEKQYSDIPSFIVDLINGGKVKAVNINYPNWRAALELSTPSSYRVNISGLGDVGGILASGLRLLGGGIVSNIGLYDLDENKILRWKYETNQILSPSSFDFPRVEGISEEELFNCDMFVFCVSVGVPAVGDEKKDVRLAQFEGNSRIINQYAKIARDRGFKGIFAVVSDPVDLLCKSAFLSSNTNENGILDFCGLAPEQIRGYGLGVMNARAAFYASTQLKISHYETQGRVFGPHGEGLIASDSIENYNDDISRELTRLVINANMDVRRAGYKPYIAPALSSGSLSLLATLKGEWHYSSTFMGGVYMGARNRLTPSGTQLERLKIPDVLMKRLQDTYNRLGDML